MFRYFLIIFLFVLACFSCTKNPTDKTKEFTPKKTNFNIKTEHKVPVKLNSYSQKKISSWKEYNELSIFLKRFENTSPNEALGNAIELKELIKEAKEENKIGELKTPAFKSRLNVFENEILRLADMTKISAIKALEVNTQIDKILSLFSSVNTKINNIYLQQRLDSDIDLTNFLTTDTIDTTSKKNIKRNTLK